MKKIVLALGLAFCLAAAASAEDDGKLTIAEHQFIEQHLKPLPWRWGPGEVALADRIQQVFEKVRSFKGDTVAREAYRKGFKDRLPSPELRRKAFAMMVAICAADGEVAESELAMLDAFGPGYLAIAQDEVARTAQAVLQAMGLGAQQ